MRELGAGALRNRHHLKAKTLHEEATAERSWFEWWRRVTTYEQVKRLTQAGNSLGEKGGRMGIHPILPLEVTPNSVGVTRQRNYRSGFQKLVCL